MAIKTRYQLKQSNGKYEIVHFETVADQVVTNDQKQFVSSQEKSK